MALPKWLIPAGLVTLVVGGLAWMRKPSLAVNDVVAIHAGHLTLLPGVTIANIVELGPSAKVALQVSKIDGDKITGYVVGRITDSGALERMTIPVGAGPYTVDRSAVTAIFRGPIGQEKKL